MSLLRGAGLTESTHSPAHPRLQGAGILARLLHRPARWAQEWAYRQGVGVISEFLTREAPQAGDMELYPCLPLLQQEIVLEAHSLPPQEPCTPAQSV